MLSFLPVQNIYVGDPGQNLYTHTIIKTLLHPPKIKAPRTFQF